MVSVIDTDTSLKFMLHNVFTPESPYTDSLIVLDWTEAEPDSLGKNVASFRINFLIQRD